MKRDLRLTAEYQEAQEFFTTIRRPGSGQLSDAAEISASSDGKFAAFAGITVDCPSNAQTSRIWRIDLETGSTQLLTHGPNTDRLPKCSPDGQQIAFLSDRHASGDFQLYLLDVTSGAVRSTVRVDGWVEYLHWSHDGQRILLGVAGRGADVSGARGAVQSKRVTTDQPSWLPDTEQGEEDWRWRHLWIYDLAAGDLKRVCLTGVNVWEAAWCGSGSLVAVASNAPGEGSWYQAQLHLIDLASAQMKLLYVPSDQIGLVAASPCGGKVAIVEAVCSDRGVVAGDLLLIDKTNEEVDRVDTHRMDVTYCEWRSEQVLLLAGHRGFETVIGVFDIGTRSFTEIWLSNKKSIRGRHATVSGIGLAGDCALIGEAFEHAPEIAVLRSGEYRSVKSLDLGYAAEASVIDAIERLTWKAPDGLEIQGWLLKPKGKGPHPVVTYLHGGPVWHWRPLWLGGGGAGLILIKQGYALFLPNPRGSSGRGQDFIRHVIGDIGGSDATDCISGIDHLIRIGAADPKRLGITGGSYGGFLTAWLVAIDPRFAAAISVFAHTNQVSEHLIGNIPHFVRLFLADSFSRPESKYVERSPIMRVGSVRTPTLNIAGALDRCAPAEEAKQFHRALLAQGVDTSLVVYPQEGHGVRHFPAAADYVARFMIWFGRYMPADARKA